MFPFPHPADGEEQTRTPRADTSEAVSQPPVKKMFRDEGEDGEAHRCGQHVENTCHVVDVKLAGHYFVLLIVTDPSQPLGLQLLHLTCWKRSREETK